MKSILFVMTLIALQNSNAMAAKDCAKEESYPLITGSELKKVATAKSAFIIDVNSPDSFKEASVPGSINFGAHQKDFKTLLPKDKNAMIVAYCGGPSCNAWLKAAKEACALGYTNIHHFKEGITGWKKI